MTYVRMADAAYAQNIPPGFDIAAGYYGGPLAYHVWLPEDWRRFPGFRAPIWVAGYNGTEEGAQSVQALQALGVPPGSRIKVDMETRRDKTYLEKFGSSLLRTREQAEFHNGFAAVRAAGYLVEVYGSESTIFENPPLNGYWVADYTSDTATIDRLLQHPGVRGVQFASNALFDTSWVKAWTEGEMWHG